MNRDKFIGKSMMGNLDEIYKQIDIDTLEKFLTGDKSFKSRYLIDMIDSIFDEELQTDADKIAQLKKTIAIWAKNNEVPSNVQATCMKLDMEKEKYELT